MHSAPATVMKSIAAWSRRRRTIAIGAPKARAALSTKGAAWEIVPSVVDATPTATSATTTATLTSAQRARRRLRRAQDHDECHALERHGQEASGPTAANPCERDDARDDEEPGEDVAVLEAPFGAENRLSAVTQQHAASQTDAAAVSLAAISPAKNSSAVLVLVRCSPVMSTPWVDRNARDSPATCTACPGMVFVDSSRIIWLSG